MSKKKNLAAAVIVLLGFIVLDQFTKWLAVMHLYQQDPIEILPGIFELHFLVNRGAAFGIMQNHQYFFAGITCVVLCVLVYVFFRILGQRRYIPMQVLLVFLMSGAVGNFLDRVRLGYVIDFLYFKLIDFPIFNVADCYVVISVFLLAVLILFHYTEEEMDDLMEQLFPGRRKKR